MTSLWIAVLSERPADADLSARALGEDGRAVGWLAAWHARDPPHEWALRADPRVADPEGTAAVVSLGLAGATDRILFDDPAVVHARARRCAPCRRAR